MFPCPISEGDIGSLSANELAKLHQTTHFLVEKAKTARHFLKASGHPLPIAQLTISEITDDKTETDHFLRQVLNGTDIGIISEAGCPGIADPGAEAISWAHIHGVKVVPFAGPSSIFMALMASGFSGQSFAFHGYLSNKNPALSQQLRSLESAMLKTGQTQIFMETPYRNGFMTETILTTLRESTRLCIACSIGAPDEDIRQMTVARWKGSDTSVFHKRPAIFLIGST